MLGYPGCAVFHGILFAPKFQSRISILKKNCKVGLYFAGKSSKFRRYRYDIESKSATGIGSKVEKSTFPLAKLLKM